MKKTFFILLISIVVVVLMAGVSTALSKNEELAPGTLTLLKNLEPIFGLLFGLLFMALFVVFIRLFFVTIHNRQRKGFTLTLGKVIYSENTYIKVNRSSIMRIMVEIRLPDGRFIKSALTTRRNLLNPNPTHVLGTYIPIRYAPNNPSQMLIDKFLSKKERQRLFNELVRWP